MARKSKRKSMRLTTRDRQRLQRRAALPHVKRLVRRFGRATAQGCLTRMLAAERAEALADRVGRTARALRARANA